MTTQLTFSDVAQSETADKADLWDQTDFDFDEYTTELDSTIAKVIPGMEDPLAE